MTRTKWASLGVGFALVLMTLVYIAEGGSVHAYDSAQLPTPPTKPVPADFFGMHIHRFATTTPWPPVPIGSIRFWDTGLVWTDLEPQRGAWKFDMLDRSIKIAEEHGADPMLTFGYPPKWATPKTADASTKEPGSAFPPDSLSDWEDYVRTVATHCKGRIHEYEIWNEPNYPNSYRGSMPRLLDLARSAYRVIKQVEPDAKVVTPAFSLEEDTGFTGLEDFLKLGGGRYADVVAVHLYVYDGDPEAQLQKIARLRALMAKYNISRMPVWNTEMGWPRQKVFAGDGEQAAFVARAYLVDWAAHVDRMYWYAWDNTVWVSVLMTRDDQKTPTPSADAYRNIQRWMVGWIVDSFSQNGDGVWICALRHGQERAHIVWTAKRRVVLRPPADWHAKTVEPLLGSPQPIASDSIDVDESPVRVR